MKKIIILILLSLFLTGCQGTTKQEVNIPFEPDNSWTMTYDGKATNTSITFTITEQQKKPNTYGNWYEIEQMIDENWQKVPAINTCIFDDIALYANDNKSLVFNINWEYCYGALESGEYRIVKYFIPYLEREATEEDKEYFYVEFTID